MPGVSINGKFRNYANVIVNAHGSVFLTVKAINYKRADSIDPVRVVGNTKPIGFTQGNETYEGSITLIAEEVDGLQATLPRGKSLPDIAAFPISVAYVDDNGLQVAHTLIACKYKENSRSSDSGSNDAQTVELPLYIHDINWNA